MKLVRPIFAFPLLLSLDRRTVRVSIRRRISALCNTTPARTCPRSFIGRRLQYTSGYADGGGTAIAASVGGWSRDYPKADNDCLIALRRLTHINSPSPLNVADLDSDHLFDYPWIYAVNVNTWTFTDEEAKRLHDYLLKGGFLMVDDFHGTDDWQHFMAGMRMVLPDAAGRGSQGRTTRFTTSSTTSTKSFRSPARSTSTPAEPMRRTATCPNGAPSATTTGASWWRSAPTCIWATPGNGPTARSIPKSFPDLRFASSSTTLRTP